MVHFQPYSETKIALSTNWRTNLVSISGEHIKLTTFRQKLCHARLKSVGYCTSYSKKWEYAYAPVLPTFYACLSLSLCFQPLGQRRIFGGLCACTLFESEKKNYKKEKLFGNENRFVNQLTYKSRFHFWRTHQINNFPSKIMPCVSEKCGGTVPPLQKVGVRVPPVLTTFYACVFHCLCVSNLLASGVFLAALAPAPSLKVKKIIKKKKN